MLKHDWSGAWARLEPALRAANTSVAERHPSLIGRVERLAYGQYYFAAVLSLLADRSDEHEIAMWELTVASDVRPDSAPGSLTFDPRDAATVSVDVSVDGIGSIAGRQATVPPGSSAPEIERIVSEFVDEAVRHLPAEIDLLARRLDDRLYRT